MYQPVKDLHVRCSLQLRNFNSPGIAMSDCCGDPASYAVVMENGSRMWRCYTHRNMRKVETGQCVTAVEIKEDR